MTNAKDLSLLRRPRTPDVDVPPDWLIDELERQRRERDERDRLPLEAPREPPPHPRSDQPEAPAPGGTVIVIPL